MSNTTPKSYADNKSQRNSERKSERRSERKVAFQQRASCYFRPQNKGHPPLNTTNLSTTNHKRVYQQLMSHVGAEEVCFFTGLVYIKGRDDLQKTPNIETDTTLHPLVRNEINLDATSKDAGALPRFVKLTKADDGHWESGGVLGNSYLGTIISQRQKVIIKEYHQKVLKKVRCDQTFVRRQGKMALTLNHPNAVRLLGYFYPEEEKPMTLVWERVHSALPVNAWLNQKMKSGKPVAPKIIIGLIAQLATFNTALTLRDCADLNIKSDNLLIQETGEYDGEMALGVPGEKRQKNLPLLKVTDWAFPIIFKTYVNDRDVITDKRFPVSYLPPEARHPPYKTDEHGIPLNHLSRLSCSWMLAACLLEVWMQPEQGQIQTDAPTKRVIEGSGPPFLYVKGLTKRTGTAVDCDGSVLPESELRRLLCRCFDPDPQIRPLPHDLAYYFREFYLSYDDKLSWEENLGINRMDLPWQAASTRLMTRDAIGLRALEPAPMRRDRYRHLFRQHRQQK